MKLEDILLGKDPVKNIRNNLSELLKLIPEAKDMIGFEHKNPAHHLDVWEHTLLALSLSEDDFTVRLVLLLHDIGKPHCFTEGDIRHYRGHQEMSSNMAENILKRLNYEEDFINRICYLIKVHDNILTEEEILSNKETTTIYKIQYCDGLAHHPEKLSKRKEYLSFVRRKLKLKEKLNSKG